MNLSPSINHEISIYGWGKENGIEFWYGRNSWGTYWGENGHFRIVMYRNNLAVEKACSWGTVEKEPTYVSVEDKEEYKSIETE